MWYQELTNWLYFGGGAALLVILLVLMSRHRVLSQFKAAEQQIQHMRSEHEQDRVRLDERSTQLLRAQQIESAQEESLQLKQQDIVRLEAEKRGLQVQLEQMLREIIQSLLCPKRLRLKHHQILVIHMLLM